jgi:hypothetical protein
MWPLSGGCTPGHNFHQRRFAGAILADNGMHAAAPNLKRDILQSAHTAEAF